jgi:hypothetical protein
MDYKGTVLGAFQICNEPFNCVPADKFLHHLLKLVAFQIEANYLTVLLYQVKVSLYRPRQTSRVSES